MTRRGGAAVRRLRPGVNDNGRSVAEPAPAVCFSGVPQDSIESAKASAFSWA